MTGNDYNVDIFNQEGFIQLDGMKQIVKFNVLGVMFLDLENNLSFQ